MKKLNHRQHHNHYKIWKMMNITQQNYFIIQHQIIIVYWLVVGHNLNWREISTKKFEVIIDLWMRSFLLRTNISSLPNILILKIIKIWYVSKAIKRWLSRGKLTHREELMGLSELFIQKELFTKVIWLRMEIKMALELNSLGLMLMLAGGKIIISMVITCRSIWKICRLRGNGILKTARGNLVNRKTMMF